MKLAFTVIFVCLLLFGLFNLKSFKWLPTIITKLAIGALVLFSLTWSVATLAYISQSTYSHQQLLVFVVSQE